METDRDFEVDLRLLARRLWRGWRTIFLATGLALVAGAALYFIVPRTYQSAAVILPITEPEYSGYVDLVAKPALSDMLEDQQKDDPRLNTFSYSRSDLLNEFMAYLQRPAHLLDAVKESGVVRSSGDKKADERAALNFIRSVTFPPPTDRKPNFEMHTRAGDEDALNKFVAWSLNSARIEVAKSIRTSILSKIAAGETMRKDTIATLTVDIASRRQLAENIRNDDMARLGEQAKIAETLGIANPVTVQALSAKGQNTPAASAQVIGGDQPLYFQGSGALNEQIDFLKNRKDSDPYTTGLRDVQRQIYLLQNDNTAATLLTVLDASPLKDPATAPLARYSLLTATAGRIFPRLSIFGIGSLLLGLVIGAGIVLMRDDKERGGLSGPSSERA
ncbi:MULTISPECIES: Wzz/FepE/Etk N-terminal domain-containing protein [unclassified Aurantimonas]|uniref:Wzz/FepE/Etk N-terminal domain-containing protein n=1 Tax=unclassified Aurantimonas TaxID=2638230 RepID=UPI002E17CBC7|nr:MULTISPECIES: Wzz/FepE/Etk N-terminal domain-containing protein [unclassified Aurantimonas]MEC5293595.1 Wzz/FepE/Etk N-terminal domain-containing protein [Aurantimonas sp. C2-3-R2]MEC5414636.1 Wzz/FepE/Etk N-terminal domain-containing protein [Aurantimonas sp. C2-4-R8]